MLFMSETEPRREGTTADLDQVLETARNNFLQSPALITREDYYGVDEAAIDAMKSINLPSIELASRLVQQTSLTVQDTIILNIFEGADFQTYSWDELFADIGRCIIGRELMHRYPDIKEEEIRRANESDKAYEEAFDEED